MDIVHSSSLPAPSAAGLNRVPRPLLALVVGLAPAIITLILIGGSLRLNLLDFRPSGWSDQVYYWHQILTFSRAGFDGGYYTVHENPPRIEFFHFGASGPFYPALFGLLARVVGWQPYTGILLNMALIALAIWGFIWLARLDQLQILLTGVALLAVAPVLMYIPTISQESFHQAAALLLAGVFSILFRRGGSLPITGKLLILAFFAVIILVRFSWVLLLPPCLLLMREKHSWRQTVAALAAAAVLGAVLIAVFQLSSAPGNNSVFRQVTQLGESPLDTMLQMFDQVVLGNIRGSFLNIEDIRQLTPDIVQGIQFSVVLVAAVAFWLKFPGNGQAFFHIYNLSFIWFAALVFYLPEGYYRLFAPHLLLTLLLLIASRCYTPVVAVAVIGFLGAGIFLSQYQQWSGTFRQRSDQAAVSAVFEEHLVYQPEAPTPWCNTLLLSYRSLTSYRLTGVPAGIGISFYASPDALAYPLKSHYLLLPERDYQTIINRLRVERLAVMPEGNLYRNLDAACN